MAEIKCLNCGLQITVKDILTTRCMRCGSKIPSSCYSCKGNCLTCSPLKASQTK